jgi:vitamin B12 transporter
MLLQTPIGGGLAAVLCAIASSAACQEVGTPPGAQAPLVVTATRTPTPADQVGSSISLITAGDIARNQWRTLPDALADTPGLNVVQEGGPGGLGSVFIRGANSNHTKVVIDGIDANDPSQNGAFDFGQVLTGDIARVEVLRGPQSSLYGSDAIGGVIDIVTVAGDGPARFDANLEGGAFETFNQTAGVRGAAQRLHYALELEHFSSGDTPVTPLDLLPPGRARIGDAYENTTLSAKLGADLTARSGVGLVVRYVDYALRFTGDDFSVFPSVPAAAQTDQNGRQLFTRAAGHFDLFGSVLQNSFGVGYSLYRTRLQSPDVPFGPQAPTFDRGDRWKVDWQGTLALAPGQTLVLGLEDARDRLIDSPVSAAVGDAGAFVELQAAPAADLNFAASVRFDDNSRFGAATTWRIAPAWRIATTGTLIRASYGTGFKAPTLTQLFVSFPAFGFYANPNLRPETSAGYDLGFEQPLWGGRLRFGATWFHNAIRQLIDPNAAGDSLANIGRATTFGAESFVAFAPTRKLTLRADYTYTVARDDETGQELLRRPRHKVTFGGTWLVTDRLRLTTNLTWLGSWVDGNRSFSIPRLNAPGYFVANVAAAFDAGHGVQLFARINNLLDRRYEDPVGFQRPGSGAFAGARVNWGGRNASN